VEDRQYAYPEKIPSKMKVQLVTEASITKCRMYGESDEAPSTEEQREYVHRQNHLHLSLVGFRCLNPIVDSLLQASLTKTTGRIGHC